MSDLKNRWNDAVQEDDPAADLLEKRKKMTEDHEYLRELAASDHQLAMDHCEVALGRQGPVLLDWARTQHADAYAATLPVALAGPPKYTDLKVYLERIQDLMLEFIGKDPSFEAFGMPTYQVARGRSGKLHLLAKQGSVSAVCGTTSTWDPDVEDAWWRNPSLERCAACVGSMMPVNTSVKMLQKVYAALPKKRTDQGVIDFE